MDEWKEMEGKLKGIEEVKKGKSAEGQDWVLYKYNVMTKEGERTCSGFVEANDLIGKNVRVYYTEASNPNGPYPFKNVKKIDEAVTKEDVDEANAKYNVADIAKPDEAKPDWDMIKKRDTRSISLSYAKDMFIAGKIEKTEIITLAEAFAKYIWSGIEK